MSNPSRDSTVRSLSNAGRKLSAATLAFHRQVAKEMGLNDTDHKCLDILIREGPMLAGQLASSGGYTSGAVTGIVNRLEKKGLARRVRADADGRRVLVEADAEASHKLMWPMLQPLLRRFDEIHSRYETAELEALVKYLNETEQALREARLDLGEP